MHIEQDVQVTIQRLRTAQQKNKNYRKAIKQLQMAYDRQRFHAERLQRTNEVNLAYINRLIAPQTKDVVKTFKAAKTSSWRFW